MPTEPAAGFCVALLGQDGAALTHAIETTLHRLGCPPPRWVHAPAVSHSISAHLRWLLAPEISTPDELQALAEQQALRAQLHALGLSYLVLRGSPGERLNQALQSLAPWQPALRPHLPPVGEASRRPGRWVCESCGDPGCEHQSFQALVASRQA